MACRYVVVVGTKHRRRDKSYSGVGARERARLRAQRLKREHRRFWAQYGGPVKKLHVRVVKICEKKAS